MDTLPYEIVQRIACFCDGTSLSSLIDLYHFSFSDSFWKLKCDQELLPESKRGKDPKESYFDHIRGLRRALDAVKAGKIASGREVPLDSAKNTCGPNGTRLRLRTQPDGSCIISQPFDDDELRQITDDVRKTYIYDNGFRCMIQVCAPEGIRMIVRDTTDWALIKTLQHPTNERVTGWIPLAPDSSILLCIDEQRRSIKILDGELQTQISHPSIINRADNALKKRIVTMDKDYVYIWNVPEANLHHKFASHNASSVKVCGTTIILYWESHTNPPTWRDRAVYLTETGEPNPNISGISNTVPIHMALFSDSSHVLIFSLGTGLVLTADGDLIGSLRASPSTRGCCTFLDTFIVTSTSADVAIWAKSGAQLVRFPTLHETSSIWDGGFGTLMTGDNYFTWTLWDFKELVQDPEKRDPPSLVHSDPGSFATRLMLSTPRREQLLYTRLHETFREMEESYRPVAFHCIEMLMPRLDISTANTLKLMRCVRKIADLPMEKACRWTHLVIKATRNIFTSKALSTFIKQLSDAELTCDEEMAVLDQIHILLDGWEQEPPPLVRDYNLERALAVCLHLRDYPPDHVTALTEEMFQWLPAECPIPYRADFLMALSKYGSKEERLEFSEIAVHYWRNQPVMIGRLPTAMIFKPLTDLPLQELATTVEALLCLSQRSKILSLQDLIRELREIPSDDRLQAITALNDIPHWNSAFVPPLAASPRGTWNSATAIFGRLSEYVEEMYLDLNSDIFERFMQLPHERHEAAAQQVMTLIPDRQIYEH